MCIARFWENVKYEAGLVWDSLRSHVDRFARRHPKVARLLAWALLGQLITVYLIVLSALVVAR